MRRHGSGFGWAACSSSGSAIATCRMSRKKPFSSAKGTEPSNAAKLPSSRDPFGGADEGCPCGARERGAHTHAPYPHLREVRHPQTGVRRPSGC